VPLHKRGKLVAAIAVHLRTTRNWTSDEIDLVRLVTARCWESIERARVARELRESETLYRTVLASMDEGLMIAEVMFDETGKEAIDYRVLETNKAFYKHTGLPLGIVGKTIREIVIGDEIPWLGIYGWVVLTGEPTRFEYEITVEPLVGWYDVFIQRIGEPHQHRAAVMFQNITERKRVEEELREQDRR
jgi:PAS domain S-box-containing protein